MGDFKEFYRENRDFIVAFVIVTIICLAGAWLVHDHYRNEPIHNDTDRTMAEFEARIHSLESRINTMQDRLEQTQKTVSGIAERVEHSTELAHEIAGGIESAESRLDSAIQRSGRIANIIADIEAKNR